MPKPGEFNDLDLHLGPAQRQLAEAVRSLIRCAGPSCRAIAKEVLLSNPVLNGLANGTCKSAPDKAEIDGLKKLHVLAEKQAGPEGIISWPELFRLRVALLSLPYQPTGECSVCGTTCPGCSTTETSEHEAAVTIETKPADEIHPAILIRLLTDHLNQPSPVVVPVPQVLGDRHNSRTIDLVWPPVTDLADYLLAGDLERANGLVRHVGIEAPADEAATAIATCRDRGMSDIAETIIGFAGRQREVRDAIRVAQSLIRHERCEDADTLLSNALGGRS
ncbi:hypothetical protein AB0L82_03335 [Nocardia sp. NPDC052001]|uniref:hypothetical protein n=1 Tax=Nocardia sp. NPDC052001 TaxID=3154853 RepID=UPI00341CECE6